MKKIKVSAPGKLMLFGEHAVIYQKACLVTAVDERINLLMEEIEGERVHISAPEVGIANYTKKITDLGKGRNIPKGVLFIEIALKNFINKYGKIGGLKITTKSDFSSKFGFGSSSAVTVATVKALSEMYSKKLSKKDIFNLSYKTVLDIQGVGSGFDLAAAIWGGTLYFVGGGKEIRPLSVKSLPLVVGYTGIKADTATLVKKVGILYRKDKEKIGKVFIGMENVAKKAKKALLTGDWKETGKLMNQNEELLESLQVGSKELSGLISASNKSGAYGAKLSGAGGGDCMIAVGPKSKLPDIKRAIAKKGGQVLEVTTSAEGVRIEREMKTKAYAPANIAFIKYWGKTNEALRLPANASISMNLSNCYTETEVEFKEDLNEDTVLIDGRKLTGEEKERTVKHLDRIRKIAKLKLKARVESKNNFPKKAGIASSASGFAALSLAASKAAGLNLSEKELSILARLGSGSACRSVPDGIVEWKKGENSRSSYAVSLYPSDYWDLRDIVVVVGEKEKKIGSTEGHSLAESSPFYKERIKGMAEKITNIKKALKKKDFVVFGEIVEREALNMHAVMMTSNPPLIYLSSKTFTVIDLVHQLKEKGIGCYFTIDAGPNVHLLCEGKNEARIIKELKQIKGIKKIIPNKIAKGASLR